MNVFLILYFFIIGTFFGSFMNVLVDRGQKGKSLLGRSKCDFCGYKLRWYDNVPIVSFLAIGGRCRKCHKKLSWQYPAVELSVGALFVVLAAKAGFIVSFNLAYPGFSGTEAVELAFYLLSGFLLSAVFLWDLKYMIIPTELVIAGSAVSIVFLLFKSFGSGCLGRVGFDCPIISGMLGMLIVGGFFFLLYHFSKGKWIGGGDVRLGFWLGLLVGWQSAYFLLMIAYVLGAVVSVGLLLRGKKKMTSKIPFGPFLVASALVVMIFGNFLAEVWHFGF